MVRRLESHVGDAAMRAATGRGHEEWRDLLADAGAMTWSHAEIAGWLVGQGVDGWWAQGITVDFEQARRGRLPGQQQDGSFTASSTRTIPGSRLEALAAVTDSVRAVHGEPSAENLAASMPVVRWRLADGTRLTASAQPANSSGTPVTLSHEKLPDHPLLEEAKRALVDLLDAAKG